MELLNSTLKNIKPLNKEVMEKASERVDKLIKPLGSLGKLEEIAIKLSGITGNIKNNFEKRCTIVMAADNGIFEEGFSACPQFITPMQTLNMLKGITGISVLSKHGNSDVKVVDIGVNADIHHPNLIDRKIRKGTSNMAKGKAMTREEAIDAIEIGIELVKECVEDGYSLIGTGEMGICNTSTSSAIIMSFTGCSSEVAIGKGAGLTEEGYNAKKTAIEKAININKPDGDDPIDVLSKVGGFDIGGLVGCYLGAASLRVPIVIDGFISSVAALIAYKLNPITRDYMITSHASEEPGFKLAMKELNLKPMLNLDMRLGEGSGCPLCFNLIDGANAVMNNMATFEEAALENDFLVDIRG